VLEHTLLTGVVESFSNSVLIMPRTSVISNEERSSKDRMTAVAPRRARDRVGWPQPEEKCSKSHLLRFVSLVVLARHLTSDINVVVVLLRLSIMISKCKRISDCLPDHAEREGAADNRGAPLGS
jgi:hypothetical protein